MYKKNERKHNLEQGCFVDNTLKNRIKELCKCFELYSYIFDTLNVSLIKLYCCHRQ
jgi:hypothetical protein